MREACAPGLGSPFLLELTKALMIAAAVSLASPAAISLTAPLTYFQAPAVTRLTPQQAQHLLDVPVRFGADIAGVRMVHDGRPAQRVATCRQYETAELHGFEPDTNFDLTMTGFLVRACGLLDAVMRARPARRSFVENPRVGVRDVEQISSAALPPAPWDPAKPTPQQERLRESTSIATFIRRNGCRITTATPVELQLRCGDMLYALTELLRADVAGDGIESIVVAPYLRSMTGTFAFPAPVIALSRTGRSALLMPVAVPPALSARMQ
jgi:hypothetical protein